MPQEEFQELDQEAQLLLQEVTNAEGLEASVLALINGFDARQEAAVVAALSADKSADEASIAAVRTVFAEGRARLAASIGRMATAVQASGSGGGQGGGTQQP